MNCDTHFYKVIDGDKEYYLPESICCKTDCTINPLFKGLAHEYYGNKHQDQTTDYIKDVKIEMGIDITKSYVAQHNGQKVTKVVYKNKKSKWDDNRFLPDTNLKEGYDKTGCDCPDDDTPDNPNSIRNE